MLDTLKPNRRWFWLRRRTLLFWVLICVVLAGWLAVTIRRTGTPPPVLSTMQRTGTPPPVLPTVQRTGGTPRVLSTTLLDSDHFDGAAANSTTFFILADDSLHAFSSSGVHLWQKDAPWCKWKISGNIGEVTTVNRPDPVVMQNAIAVLNCKAWKLSLDTYDFKGNLLATVQVLPYNMEPLWGVEHVGGIVHLAKTVNGLAFGFCLHMKSGDDKRLMVFDTNLHKLRTYDGWG
jgi:hypothetical protein